MNSLWRLEDRAKSFLEAIRKARSLNPNLAEELELGRMIVSLAMFFAKLNPIITRAEKELYSENHRANNKTKT